MTALTVAYHTFKLYYRNIVAWKSINSKMGNLLALHSAQENTCMLRVYSHLQINKMRNYPSLLGTKRDKDMTQYIGTEIHIKHGVFTE